MDEKTFKKILDKALDPIKESLDNPKTGLKRLNEKVDILWDQVAKVTENQEDMKDTLKSHTVHLKTIEKKADENYDNTKKLDKRLSEVEKRTGIIPPVEFTLTS